MAKVWVLGEEPEGSREWRVKRPKPPKQQAVKGSGEFDGSVICSCQARHPANRKLGCNCTEFKQYKGKEPKKWMCVQCSNNSHTWAPIY